MTDNLKHKIIKYLNSEYGDLTPYETEKYPNYIFFMKDGKLIFVYNKKNGYVGVSYDKIWSFLENFFGLEYEEIQGLTKEWVEEHYKLGVRTTIGYPNWKQNLVEEHYKLGVRTTSVPINTFLPKVEEHYKLRVRTTIHLKGYNVKEVEEHYKLRVITTDIEDMIPMLMWKSIAN